MTKNEIIKESRIAARSDPAKPTRMFRRRRAATFVGPIRKTRPITEARVLALGKPLVSKVIIEAIIAVGAHIGLLFLACRPEQFESRAQNEVRRASEAVMSRSDQAIRGLDDLGSGMLEQVQ